MGNELNKLSWMDSRIQMFTWIIWPSLIAYATNTIMTIALTDIPKDKIMFIWFSLSAFISLITLPFVDFANEPCLDGMVRIKSRKQLYDRGTDPWPATSINAPYLMLGFNMMYFV